MRIDPKIGATPVAPASPVRRVAGGSFSVQSTPTPPRAGGPSAVGPVGSLDALLALQEDAGGSGDRRRRAAQRGHDLLDALDRLKAALLSGRVPVSDLKAIASRLAERRDSTGDPRLDEVIAHIELRAQVELAKLGGAGDGEGA
ncbi:MAG: flagellar assembly protein fliX [Salinarimonadaceae bacterium]|nr:MAG: flagellar assembly protein fliX [Salinarimonadaceae bacterium]